MPEQLLGRIIKVSSNPGELVLDPFSGSATTTAVAKKLGRNFLAFDISDEYITRGLERLKYINAGDPLVGAPEPKVSAPATPAVPRSHKSKTAKKSTDEPKSETDPIAEEIASKDPSKVTRTKRAKPTPKLPSTDQTRPFNFDESAE